MEAMKAGKPGNQFIRQITCLYLWKESTDYTFFNLPDKYFLLLSGLIICGCHMLENVGRRGFFSDAASVVLGISLSQRGITELTQLSIP